MQTPAPTYHAQLQPHHDTLVVTLRARPSFATTLALNTIAHALGVKHDAGLASTWHQADADVILARTPVQAFLCLSAAVVPHKGTGRGRTANTLTVAFTGDAKTLGAIQRIAEQIMCEKPGGLGGLTYRTPVLSTPNGAPDNVVHLTFEKDKPWWL